MSGHGDNGIYKIGYYYNRNGKEGVVYAISDGGRHGEIVSAEQTQCSWSAAKSWCANLGSGWKLPSKSQLLMIYRNKEKINTALAAKGFEQVVGGYWYWSSDEYNTYCAWLVGMSGDDTNIGDKNFDFYVRAVSAF